MKFIVSVVLLSAPVFAQNLPNQGDQCPTGSFPDSWSIKSTCDESCSDSCTVEAIAVPAAVEGADNANFVNSAFVQCSCTPVVPVIGDQCPLKKSKGLELNRSACNSCGNENCKVKNVSNR